ncbi:cation transporter [Lujinxingia sediminis]|uniref:Cation transporter n=1 Tax=Lujinxingia sediminis TaxID=2480984 RepID=A0ABY0CXN3_9DELT|nr:Na+/H+ antiporter subunit E [Lujinxingia sediminis]RVU48400.1 cation transporter [Lujinxingia sediminis]
MDEGGAMAVGVFWRVVFFASLWWIWAGDKPASWWFGAPSVLGAAIMAARRVGDESQRVRVRGLVVFLLYFVRASFKGGLDVAWRAISPRMRLRPGFLEYPLRLDGERAPAVFFANIISLLPGTLSVELGARSVMVHAIDLEAPVEAQLQELEERIAVMFGAGSGGAT